MNRFERSCTIVFAATYIAAALLYAVHGLPENPQYDNQVIWYARDMRESLVDGTFSEYLLAERKYPLLYVVPFAVSQKILYEAMDLTGIVSKDVHGFLLARIVTLAFAAGTFMLLGHLSRKLVGDRSAMALLGTSLLFLMFSSAVRPHLPAAFWTLAAFAASVHVREHGGRRNSLVAWGTATVAFCTLQSGLFAFVFPIWAHIRNPRDWRAWAKAFGIAAGCAALGLGIGYPFVFAELLDGQTVSVDLGHNVEASFGFSHGLRVVSQLLGNSPILLGFALTGAVRRWMKLDVWPDMFLPIVIYLALFFGTFAFHSYGMSRFFLSALPLVALLGLRAWTASPAAIRIVVLLLMTAAYAKFGWLALQPSTYQRIGAFAETREGSIAISVDIPSYFTSIPERRFPASVESEDFHTMMPTDAEMIVPQDPWYRCAHYVSSPTTNEIVLLWNDTSWALYRVFEASMFGPNISVYCR